MLANNYLDSVGNENDDVDKPIMQPVKRTVAMPNEATKPFKFGDYFDAQWDMNRITGQGKYYDSIVDTSKVTVGVIDSGIDFNHSDLTSSNTGKNKNFVPKGGYENSEPQETGQSNFNEDLTGHGTQVSGQIAANGNLDGTAPGVKLRTYRVFGEKKSKVPWILEAIIAAADDKVKIINMSLGQYVEIYDSLDSNDTNTEAYKKAIQYAQSQGTLVVAAVGDDGINDEDQMALHAAVGSEGNKNKTIKNYPADLPNVVKVGSVGPDNQLSTFSNYFKNNSEFMVVPGVDLKEQKKLGIDEWTKQQGFQDEWILSASNDGGYTYTAGTSFAAPKVTGVLAELIAKNNFYNDPVQAIATLRNTASVTPDGFNEVDAFRALGQ